MTRTVLGILLTFLTATVHADVPVTDACERIGSHNMNIPAENAERMENTAIERTETDMHLIHTAENMAKPVTESIYDADIKDAAYGFYVAQNWCLAQAPKL